MNISDDFMRELIKSIHILYSHDSKEEERNTSINFTTEFLNHPAALEVSFNLIEPYNEPVVRYYGLSTIEHIIKNSINLGENNEIINRFSPEQKDFIRNSIIQHIQKIGQDDDVSLKKKLSIIMVELLKLQLFDSKENLVPYILSIVPEDSSQVEIILSILKIFIEDIDTLPKNKWKIAVDNIEDSMSDKLLPYIYYLLNNHFTAFKESNSSISESIINSCLQLLQSISEAEWMPLSILKNYQILIDALFYLLSEHQFKVLTSEVLVGIFSKFTLNRPDMLKYIIELANILEKQMDFLNSSDINENIKFIQRISQSLSILASSYVSNIHITHTIEDIGNVISIIGTMSNHPSLIVSNYSLSFWGTLLSSQTFYESSTASEVIKSVFSTYMENIKMWDYKDILPSDKHHIFRINDFFTEEDYLTFMTNYTNNFKNYVLNSLTKHVPDYTLKLLIEHIEDISNKITNSSYDFDSKNIKVIFSSYKILLKKISIFMNDLVESRKHLDLIKAYYERILNINSNMATVINFQIQFILLNLNYLQIDESILEMVIYKMMYFVGYNNHSPIAIDENIRHKACNKLIHIGKKLSNKLINLYPMITKIISENDLQDQYANEKMKIFLISISNSLPLDHLKELLNSVLSNYIEKWTSIDLRNALSKFDSFVQFFHLNDLSNINGIEIRKQFVTLLKMFKSVWLSVSVKMLKNIEEPHPLFDKNLIILENIFTLIKYIHYILSDEGSHVIGFNPNRLSIDYKSACKWIKKDYQLNQDELELNKFINPIRQSCYTIVGKASGHCNHIFEQYFQSLIPSISFYMDQLDIFSWKFIFNCIFKNLYTNDLENNYGNILEFFSYAINCFRNRASLVRNNLENGLNDPLEEIILFNSLTSTSESFLEFIEKSLFLDKEKPSKLFSTLMMQDQAMCIIIESLSMILEWNIALLNKYCCKIVNVLIQAIRNSSNDTIQYENIIQGLFTHLFEALLKIISNQIIPMQRRLMSIILEMYTLNNVKFKEILQKSPKFTLNEFTTFETKANHKNKIVRIRALRILLENMGILPIRQKVLDIPPSDFVEYTMRRATNLIDNINLTI